MTKFNFAYLACRLLALYCIFNALDKVEYAVGGLGNLMNGGWSHALLPVAWFLPFLLTLSFGIALWFYAHSIAERIFSSRDDTAIGGDLNPEALRVLAFSVIGVFLIVDAVPQVVQTFASWVQSSELPAEWSQQFTASTIAHLCKLGVMLAFGIWLTLGPKGIAAWIDRLGTPATDSNDPDPQQGSESE